MAKLNAPLMSFAASGKIAKSLVYATWKGIDTVRQYVVPSNPKTPAQQAQRSLLTMAVNLWRASWLSQEIRESWNKLASTRGLAMSGFNLFTGQVTKLAAEDPDASIASGVKAVASNSLEVSFKNIDDGSAGDESGDFELLYGNSPDDLVGSATAALATGKAEFTIDCEIIEENTPGWGLLRKASASGTVYDRSGIFSFINNG